MDEQPLRMYFLGSDATEYLKEIWRVDHGDEETE